MAERTILGPEQPTFIEELVNLLRLPYWAGSLVLAALAGPVGQLLARYLETFDLNGALVKTFSLSLQQAQSPTLEGVINQATYFAFLLFAIRIIRFMRTKVLGAEPALVPLSPQGETTLHRAFGRVSRRKPPALLTVVLLPLLIPYLFLGSAGLGSPVFLIYATLSSVLLVALIATFLWVYYGSLRGLQTLGRETLRLKSYWEDSMLGARPIGSLSLSLALAYFAGVALLTAGTSVSPDPLGIALLVVFAMLGVVFFFLPLTSVHRQMLREKQRAHAALQTRLSRLVTGPHNPNSPDGESPLTRLVDLLATQIDLLGLQMARQEVANIATWPFDTRIIGRLSVIITTVLAILVARLISFEALLRI